MKNKIYLYWFKYDKGKGNFGDELNPYLIQRLSDSKVVFADYGLMFDGRLSSAKILIYRLLKNQIKASLFLKYFNLNVFVRPGILLAVGSILNFSYYSKLNVWGSGLISKDRKITKRKFYAVRGKLTREILINQGHQIPEVYGDPAILLPLVYQPKTDKKYKIGIIPHYEHYEELKNIEDENTIVINLLDDIETVIEQIVSCEKTLSTSLHGIIVSHAYQTPSLWTVFEQTDEIKLKGDDMKFEDYFSSVDIEAYPAEKFSSAVVSKFENNPKVLPDSAKIEEIQLGLLKAAPFELNNKFQSIIGNNNLPV